MKKLPPVAYFQLKDLVTANNANMGGLIQLIPSEVPAVNHAP